MDKEFANYRPPSQVQATGNSRTMIGATQYQNNSKGGTPSPEIEEERKSTGKPSGGASSFAGVKAKVVTFRDDANNRSAGVQLGPSGREIIEHQRQTAAALREAQIRDDRTHQVGQYSQYYDDGAQSRISAA